MGGGWLKMGSTREDIRSERTAAGQGFNEKKSPRISLAVRPMHGKTTTTTTVGSELTGSIKWSSRGEIISCDEIISRRRDVISRNQAARFKLINNPNSRNHSSVSRDTTSGGNEWKRTDNGGVVRRVQNRIPVWEVENTEESLTGARDTEDPNSKDEHLSSWVCTMQVLTRLNIQKA